MEKLTLDVIFLLFTCIILINSGVDKEWRHRQKRKNALKQQRAEILGRKTGRVEKYITAEENLVSITNTSRNTYAFLMGASVIAGYIIGKLIFTDSMVSIALAGICIILPHAFLIIKSNNDKRELAENLESAMRIITHEYISTNDFEKAVANTVDNIEHDRPFREFLVDMNSVSSSVERNLRRLETKENNVFFSRWIDQLILTQTDRSQIANLMPILDEMNDAKTAQRRNDTQVAAAWREYFTLLFIILLSPLLVRVIQHEWYNYLITTFIGKILVIAMLACLVWATGRALKINQPITG